MAPCYQIPRTLIAQSTNAKPSQILLLRHLGDILRPAWVCDFTTYLFHQPSSCSFCIPINAGIFWVAIGPTLQPGPLSILYLAVSGLGRALLFLLSLFSLPWSGHGETKHRVRRSQPQRPICRVTFGPPSKGVLTGNSDATCMAALARRHPRGGDRRCRFL